MFSSFTFRDLTDDLTGICDEWQKHGLGFDAIYMGYLGSFRQLDICADIFDKFNSDNNFVLIDPVMADNGKLYPGFDQNFALNMAKLCGKADIIVPNLTEASFMLQTEYVAEGYSEEYIKTLLKKLVALGCKKAVLTGVSFDKKQLGVYAYDSQTDEYFSYYREKLPVSFHGTGDVFASTLLGAMAKGRTMQDALKVAVDYTVECIKVTMDNPEHNFYGVEFENALPYLIKRIDE